MLPEGPNLEAFLREHRAEFVAFALRRVHERADAEDIVQQAFARASLQGAQLRDPNKLRPWLFQTIRNLLVDQHRAAGRHVRTVAGDAADRAAALAPASASEAEASSTCACVLGQLSGLKPEYAQILQSVILDETRVTDIAHGDAAQANALHVRLHRAKQALKKRLAAHCGTTSLRALSSCSCAFGGMCGASRAPLPAELGL